MNNMTFSVQPIGNGVVTNEKVSLILSEKLPNNVRPGMLLTFSELPDLNLLNNKNLLELKLTLPNGENIQVMAKTNASVNVIDFAKPNLVLRVTQDGNLQFVSVKADNANNISINKDFVYNSYVPEAVTCPTKLMPMLDKIMQEELLPVDIKNWVREVMADAEFVAKLKSFEMKVGDDDILMPLKKTLVAMKNILPEQKETLKQQFIRDVENLVGKSFDAKFCYGDANTKIATLETPLGKILAETFPKLTKNEMVQMEVSKVNLGNKPELLRIIKEFDEYLMKILPIDNRQINGQMQLLQNSNKEATFLTKILSPLLGLDGGEKYAANLLQKIAGLKTNILSDIYGFYRSARLGSAKDWLGDNLYGELRALTNGNEVLQNIEQLLQSSVKEMPLWRIVEIPFFDGSQLFNWRISVKKTNDEHTEKNRRRNDEVRFVIDTEFSKLGAFQFDGFALKKQKRFDLVIRTSLRQSEDFCSNIMALFKKSLADLDYSGTIKINQKEEFLKPYIAENKVVNGVYI